MKRIIKVSLVILLLLCTFFMSIKMEMISAAETFPFNGIINVDALVIYSKNETESVNKVTELAYGTRIKVNKKVNNLKKSSCASLYEITYDTNKIGYACIESSSEKYIVNLDTSTLTTDASGTESYNDYCAYLGSVGFPESYCPYLYNLHVKYPEWIFKADQTGLSLATASKEEESKCSLQTANTNYWLSEKPDESNYYWVKASVIASFMDPRNSLFEDTIFQFFDSDDNKDLSSDATLEYLVGNGYLKNFLSDFKTAASKNGINVVQLVARSKQEGNNTAGYAPSSGTYTTTSGNTYNGKSLDGYYNFYNINAVKTGGLSVHVNSLAYAASYFNTTNSSNTTFQRPWNTQAKAISGGAEFLTVRYIQKGQDTIYYQKFNVSSYKTNSTYTNQYMTNINAPEAEGKSMYKTYKESNSLHQAFVFTIPVYTDMDSVYQAVDKNSNNNLSTIMVNDKEITGFSKDVTEYVFNLVTDSNTIKVSAKTEASISSVEGTGNYTFVNGVANVKLIVTAESGSKKTYVLTIKQVLPENSVSVESIISKLAVKVNDSYMYGISPGTDVTSIINTVTKYSGQVSITDKDGKAKKTGSFATGDKITITGTTESKTYTIAVRGDVNGDGVVKINDLILIQSHILEKNILKDVQFYAADVNYDGVIKINDLILVQSHILSKVNL